MSLPLPSSIFNGFGFFMDIANRYPTLSAAEEKDHLHKFLHLNNQESYKTLVLSNLRFVGFIAQKYSGYGMPLVDLAQEGVIGLIKAVKNFDTSFDVRLSSFAVHSIKFEIHEYVIKNYSMIKIATTKAQRKLFFNKNKILSESSSLSDDEVSKIATELNIPSSEVIHMEKRIRNKVISLDSPSSDDDEQKGTIVDNVSYGDSELLESIELSESNDIKSSIIKSGLDLLDDRSKDIISRRWLVDNKSTLTDLANEYSVSAERIRQIEKNAMNKIKKNLSDQYAFIS